MFMEGVLASFVAAILFAVVLYLLYVLSASQLKRNRLFARDLWWLPAWRCWRFVLRNMEGNANLCGIEYRCWLREIVPAQPGSSPQSFRDTGLSVERRIILPTRQDLPILCFRFEKRDDNLVVVHTDKFGVALGEFSVTGPNKYELKAEYSLETMSRFGFPHRVRRLLTVPQKASGRNGEVNIFSNMLARQGNSECFVRLVFTSAEQISVRFAE